MRIDDTNPICWQTALTDSEIVQMLHGHFSARRFEPKKSAKAQSLSANVNPIARQQLCNSEDDICPICQDLMLAENALTWYYRTLLPNLTNLQTASL